MIKKMIILTGLLLALLFVQLFQTDIRLSFGQTMTYPAIQLEPDIMQSKDINIDIKYPMTYTAPDIVPMDYQQDIEIQLLKEQINKVDDPCPLINVEKYLYQYYFDWSA